MRPAREVNGFTLIEVMIAVAIVALLTAIALPSYQEHVRKGKRAEGKSALLKTMQLQERVYTANGIYQTDVGPLYGLAPGAEVRSSEDPAGNGWYVITADTTGCVPANDLRACVRVVATPRNGFVDDRCNVLSLNSRSVQDKTGTESLQYCWR